MHNSKENSIIWEKYKTEDTLRENAETTPQLYDVKDIDLRDIDSTAKRSLENIIAVAVSNNARDLRVISNYINTILRAKTNPQDLVNFLHAMQYEIASYLEHK